MRRNLFNVWTRCYQQMDKDSAKPSLASHRLYRLAHAFHHHIDNHRTDVMNAYAILQGYKYGLHRGLFANDRLKANKAIVKAARHQLKDILVRGLDIPHRPNAEEMNVASLIKIVIKHVYLAGGSFKANLSDKNMALRQRLDYIRLLYVPHRTLESLLKEAKQELRHEQQPQALHT